VEDLKLRGRDWHGEEAHWEQILPDEAVIKWTRFGATRKHRFEVVHQPTDGLTNAQAERIQAIESWIEREFSKVNPFFAANNPPPPSIGCGWGL